MSDDALKKSTMAEVAIVRVFVVICQLVFLKVYTHYVSLYELGIYYFLFTISYSLNAFVLVPLDYFQQSQLYKFKQLNISLRSLFYINKLIIRLALILMLVSCGICAFIKPELCLLMLLVILLSVSTYGVSMTRGIINNLELRRQAIYTLLFETVAKVLIFLVLLQFLKPTALLILSSMLCASAISLILLFILLKRLPEYKAPNLIKFNIKDIFHFAYPISIGAVINWIQLQSYTLVLVPLGFVEAVGIFGTVANIGSSGMNACSTVFSQLFVPNIYKSNGTYITIYIRNAVFAILFVLTCSTLLSDIIVGLLTKASLIPYSKILIYGILTEGGNFLIGSLTIYFTIHNFTKSTIKMSLLGLVIFFISFFTLFALQKISPFTLGIPMVLTQYVIAGGLFLLVYKHTKHAI
jgi:O-antigen/teichoic acid export membrane protein